MKFAVIFTLDDGADPDDAEDALTDMVTMAPEHVGALLTYEGVERR